MPGCSILRRHAWNKTTECLEMSRCQGGKKALFWIFKSSWSRREGRCVLCCSAEDSKYLWRICCSVSFLPTHICWAPTICISSQRWNGLPRKTVSSVTEIFKQRLNDCQGYSKEDFCRGGKMDEWLLKPLPALRVHGPWRVSRIIAEGPRSFLCSSESNLSTLSTLSPIHRNTKGVPASPTLPQFLPQM